MIQNGIGATKMDDTSSTLTKYFAQSHWCFITSSVVSVHNHLQQSFGWQQELPSEFRQVQGLLLFDIPDET